MAVKSLDSVSVALRALERVAELQPVGVTALAQALGVDKSRTQRVLVTLAESGWVVRAAGEPVRWELASKAFVVGRAYHADRDWRSRARALLEEIGERTHETVMFWVRDGDYVVLVDRIESPQTLVLNVRLGMRVALSVGCAGRSILASLPEAEASAHLTPAARKTWRKDRAAILRRGYAENLGIGGPDTFAVGAMLDLHPSAQAALAVGAPLSRTPRTRQRELSDALLTTMREHLEVVPPDSMLMRDAVSPTE